MQVGPGGVAISTPVAGSSAGNGGIAIAGAEGLTIAPIFTKTPIFHHSSLFSPKLPVFSKTPIFTITLIFHPKVSPYLLHPLLFPLLGHRFFLWSVHWCMTSCTKLASLEAMIETLTKWLTLCQELLALLKNMCHTSIFHRARCQCTSRTSVFQLR